MNLSATLYGDKKIARDLKKAGSVINLKANKFLLNQAIDVERIEKKEVPVDQAVTQNSIRIDRNPLKMSYEVKAHSKYAPFVHNGRKPGKMPPFGEGTSLASWARRKGIPAFMVARSIGRKGTKGKKFADIAYKRQKPIFMRESKQLLTEIVRGI